ncbi:MAG: hypothetical protein ACXIUD_09795 [Mongoliitalea sp.]
MPVYSYGLKSVKYAPIDPETKVPGAFVTVGKIYRDTGEFQQEDAAVTDHLEELSDYPVVTTNRKGLSSVRMRLMDTSAANKVIWLGGTITTVADQPDQWNEPNQHPNIEYAFEFEFEDGSIKGINRGKVMAKDMPDPKRSGFHVIDVMIKVLQPEAANLPITYSKDPV